MIKTYAFLKSVLDSVSEQIVVIEKNGDIVFVNRSWVEFGKNNNSSIKKQWESVNYISECEKAATMGDEFGEKALAGIRSVVNKEEPDFYFEYPCHSQEEERWFMMRISPLCLANSDYFVVSHQNISERKLAEKEMLNQSRVDGLTQIPNRRGFDEFLSNEWKRCARLKKNIALAIMDLDHFKLLNDTYGHQAGDQCLIEVGRLLKSFTKRPNDFCARYGGEEFVLIWGDSSPQSAKDMAQKLLADLAALNIPNKKSPLAKCLTASIGLASMVPDRHSDAFVIIKKADDLLYKAKKNGRFRIEV